jgi:DNA-binding response OmpR family regulator
MAKPLIIVVEDEPDIREIMLYNLRREGYEAEGFESGSEGLEAIRAKQPNLVILDLMLPGMDGLTVCQQVRAEAAIKATPIIIVSAKEEESDVVIGLGLGADDYVPKPFSPRELLARVKAVLRRSQQADQGDQHERVVIGDLIIDLEKHNVTIDGQLVKLTATEFKLLYQLASHPGRAYTREQLLNRVVGDGVVVVDRNIDVHIRAVRKKIGNYADHIQTVRGVGYRFAEQ